MNIKEVLKNIARSILKDELIELDNQIINLTDLNINQSEQIEELSIELTRLTNQDKSADEIYYTTKYPEEKITYTRTDKLGTHEIDVRTFLQPINHKYPKYTGKDDDIALKCLKYIIDNYKYRTDMDSFGQDEYWAFPHETLKNKFGDCEDGSLLLASIMLYNKIPSWKIRISAGWVLNPYTWNKEGHAYVTYYCEEDKSWKILDWCYLPDKTKIKDRVDYKENQIYQSVWFSFNDKSAWGSKADIREANQEMLNRNN